MVSIAGACQPAAPATGPGDDLEASTSTSEAARRVHGPLPTSAHGHTVFECLTKISGGRMADGPMPMEMEEMEEMEEEQEQPCETCEGVCEGHSMGALSRTRWLAHPVAR
eukprot:2150593-Rhodomonas_salina.3